MPDRLLPENVPAPLPPPGERFRFEVLGPEHNEADLAAWTGSIEHIRDTPGFPLPDGWPERVHTPEENLCDLTEHRRRHLAGADLAWTVIEPGSGTVIGCVYLKPDGPGRAIASSWVASRHAELDGPLRDHLRPWLTSVFDLRISYAEPLPRLTGRAIVLRRQREEDLETLGRFLADSSVARWFGMDTVDELRAGDDRIWTILAEDAVAGWLLVEEELHPDYKAASLDIMLGPEFQGRGLGPAALGLALRWLFGERGHHRCTIDPAAANVRAIASYKKVGFRQVGVTRRSARAPDGSWEDSLLMDLLAEELSDR